MREVSRAILPRGSQSNTSVEAGGRPWFGHREARSASRGRFPRTVGATHVARPIPRREPRAVSFYAPIGGTPGPTTPRDQPLVPPQLPPQAPIVPAQFCSRCSSSVHSPRTSPLDSTAECSIQRPNQPFGMAGCRNGPPETLARTTDDPRSAAPLSCRFPDTVGWRRLSPSATFIVGTNRCVVPSMTVFIGIAVVRKMLATP